ncbi:hypothetical protein [Burkholderia phage BCSR129]|nr:hypothetical protein [Burkholderia phage BCSR129]
MNQGATNLENIMQQRGSQYGDFTLQAALAQHLKQVIYGHCEQVGNQAMNAVHCEAMDMIAHKISRIANGNPNNPDSWRDIAGYAMLVADRIELAMAKAAEVMAEQKAADTANTGNSKKDGALTVSPEQAAAMAAQAAAVVAQAAGAAVSPSASSTPAATSAPVPVESATEDARPSSSEPAPEPTPVPVA